MNNLFKAADKYAGEADWKELGLLKICLLSLGMLLGMKFAPKHRKTLFGICLTMFVVTYIPLMAKFFRLLTAKDIK